MLSLSFLVYEMPFEERMQQPQQQLHRLDQLKINNL
jgi:hypothetical protein